MEKGKMSKYDFNLRVDNLLPTHNGQLRQHVFRNFTKNDRRYVVLAEYNAAIHDDGIYYGIMCKDCHNKTEAEYLLNEWQELRNIIYDWTRLTFGNSVQKVSNSLFWVLWIQLNDDEAADSVIINTDRIIRVLDDKKLEYGIKFDD